MSVRAAAVALALAACATPADDDADTDAWPEGLAPLATPTAACPDLSEPGLVTFESAGETRRALVLFPEGAPAGLPVMFVFHGLTTPDQDPLSILDSGFDLSGLADEWPAIVVVPEARPTDLFGQQILLWGILSEEARAQDLALFDDLRACVVDGLDADPTRVTAWGHSGGGLWSSVLVGERADALAAIVVASGGVGEFPAPAYTTPARDLPTLIVHGGATDKWPDPTFALIDFEATSGTLRDLLVADGQRPVVCTHELGHFTLPSWFWRGTKAWLKRHAFGEPSPWLDGDAELPSSTCERTGG